MTAVEEVRRFNRFYSRHFGLLDEHLFEPSSFSLPEARVLFELAAVKVAAAADLSRALIMDKSHLSRVVARFRSLAPIRSRVSPEHSETPAVEADLRGEDGILPHSSMAPFAS